jgi:hypothetical protein
MKIKKFEEIKYLYTIHSSPHIVIKIWRRQNVIFQCQKRLETKHFYFSNLLTNCYPYNSNLFYLNRVDRVRPELLPELFIGGVDRRRPSRQLDDGLSKVQLRVRISHSLKIQLFFHLFDTKTILAVAGVIHQLPRKQATYGLFILIETTLLCQ